MARLDLLFTIRPGWLAMAIVTCVAHHSREKCDDDDVEGTLSRGDITTYYTCIYTYIHLYIFKWNTEYRK